MKIEIDNLMSQSGVQFGTSGVRGLVVDMTDRVCWVYVTAFLQFLQQNNLIKPDSEVGIAGDLRASSERIMNAVAAAVSDFGLIPKNYGTIPSPAIALYGLEQCIPTIMVTGSHIPDDRNGIKFNTPAGEILKADELQIRNQTVDIPADIFLKEGSLKSTGYLPLAQNDANQFYIDRYLDFFPENCLKELNIGLYQHSAVTRDCLQSILEDLGAKVTSLGRSNEFISVDTEAIRAEDIALAEQWSAEFGFDAIVSTDGDGDRPLVSDENGNWLRGDIVGFLCGQYLNIDVMVTPVSSNSAVEKCGIFNKVLRTKIGSPYVIEAMQKASQDKLTAVGGYEANGGFLLETDVIINDKKLIRLPTRDAVIVIISVLMVAKQKQQTVSELLATLPSRYTTSGRLKAFPTELSQQYLAKMVTGDLQSDLNSITNMFDKVGQATDIDTTDGVRITFSNDEIVHLRPSGNAPELRCYNEAATAQRAEELNSICMAVLTAWQ
jgi:phosphomannomutase